MQIFSLEVSPLVLIVVILAFTLLLLEIFTIGYTFIRQFQERRQSATAQSTREKILETVRTEQPPYDTFCSNITQKERTAAAQEIESLIETTSKPVTDNLRHLGKELGMYETAVKKINRGDRIDRLNALTTLSLLRHPPAESDIRAHCLGDPVLRGAGAHALISSRTSRGYREALRVLYHESSDRLSVLGMETVYTIGRRRPELLLNELADLMPTEDSPGLVQTLLVIAELEIEDESDDLPQWVTTALSADEPQVRAAAVRSLEASGATSSQQSTTALITATSDSAQQVRIAAAEVVDTVDDDRTLLRELARAFTTEPDPYVRQEMVRTLIHQGYRPEQSLPPAAMKSWEWGVELVNPLVEERV